MIFVVRRFEIGELAVAELEFHMTALGDLGRILKGFVQIAEYGAHLLLTFEVEFFGLEAHFFILDGAVGLDTQKDIMQVAVLFADIMAVIGDDQTRADGFRDLFELVIQLFLLLDPVILQFDKVIFLTEHTLIIPRLFQRAVIIVGEDTLRHLTRHTGGQTDQALVVLLEQLIVHTGLVIKAVGERERYQLHQILIAGLILAQQDQVIILPVQLKGFIKAGTRRDIDLTADDRAYPLLFTFSIKIDHTVHDAVIGYGKGILSELLSPFNQAGDPTGAVQ